MTLFIYFVIAAMLAIVIGMMVVIRNFDKTINHRVKPHTIEPPRKPEV